MANNHNIALAALLALLAAPCAAQSPAEVVSRPLSPAETRFEAADADMQLDSRRRLYAQPSYQQWLNASADSASRLPAIIYSSLGGSSIDGDFLPYQGRGSADVRVGGYGEYGAPRLGTLSGSLEYATGRHRGIGWNATRQAEDYLPYLSTDSIGGDYRYRRYRAAGRYAFTLGRWTLGAGMAFDGEQAWRLSDPRALNNTTWLRPDIGAAFTTGSLAVMAKAGYGRARQHMQLRYWRPGEQDRFFVCYGFGLYDTRQSGVTFGKSRMYYIDEWNAAIDLLNTARAAKGSKPKVSLQAGLSMTWQHMKTEEADIYNLYEARTLRLAPYATATASLSQGWRLRVMAEGAWQRRRGYENIIEEYLIDKDNNIYDFRTLDTQQNYVRHQSCWRAALAVEKTWRRLTVTLQGGVEAERDEEKYRGGEYLTRTTATTPHARLALAWQGSRDRFDLALQWQRHMPGDGRYDVVMANNDVPHLDFQMAFAPYAYRDARHTTMLAKATYCHRFAKTTAGITLRGFTTNGRRSADAVYTGTPGFASTAPMVSPEPDRHDERWGRVELFLTF